MFKITKLCRGYTPTNSNRKRAIYSLVSQKSLRVENAIISRWSHNLNWQLTVVLEDMVLLVMPLVHVLHNDVLF